MALNDLTGQNIQDTYKKLVQTEGNTFADGSGSAITTFNVTSSHAISASYALSASHEITYELSSSHAETTDALTPGIDINVRHVTASGNISMSNSGEFHGQIGTLNPGPASLDYAASGGDIVVQHLRGYNNGGINRNGKIKISQGQIIIHPSNVSSNTVQTYGLQFYSGDHGYGTGDNPSINTFTVGDLELKIENNTIAKIEPTGIDVTGQITASGNISASGDIYGQDYYSNGQQIIDYDGSKIRVGNVPLNIPGNITASGNISGSVNKTISAGSGSFHVLKGDTTKATSLFIKGQITASGNISSSGTVTATQIACDEITGTIATPAQTQITSVGTLTAGNVTAILPANIISSSNQIATPISGALSTAAIASLGGGYISSSLQDLGNITGSNISSSGIITAEYIELPPGGAIRPTANNNTISFRAASHTSGEWMEIGSDIFKVYMNGGASDINLSPTGLTLNNANSNQDVRINYQNGDAAFISDASSHYTRMAGPVVISRSGSGATTPLGSGFSAVTDGNSALQLSGSLYLHGLTSHITASGNISSSGGTVTTKQLTLGHASRVDIKFTNDGDEDHYIRKDGDFLRFRGHDDSTVLLELRNNTNGSNATSFPNGNHGIGTTTPGEKLVVAGNISASGNIITEGHITASGNISSSGNIVADYYDAKTSGTGYKLSGVKLVYLDSSVNAWTFGRQAAATRISGSTIELSGGHVTASGNISASGELQGNYITAKTPIVQLSSHNDFNTNTSGTGDINQDVGNEQQLSWTVTDFADTDYFTVSSSWGIGVKQTGRYKISAHAKVYSTGGARPGVVMQFYTGSSFGAAANYVLPPEYNTYIRVQTGTQNKGNIHATDYTVQLNSGSFVSTICGNKADYGGGAVVRFSGSASYFNIEYIG